MRTFVKAPGLGNDMTSVVGIDMDQNLIKSDQVIEKEINADGSSSILKRIGRGHVLHISLVWETPNETDVHDDPFWLHADRFIDLFLFF